jgi:hypothetical protein
VRGPAQHRLAWRSRRRARPRPGLRAPDGNRIATAPSTRCARPGARARRCRQRMLARTASSSRPETDRPPRLRPGRPRPRRTGWQVLDPPSPTSERRYRRALPDNDRSAGPDRDMHQSGDSAAAQLALGTARSCPAARAADEVPLMPCADGSTRTPLGQTKHPQSRPRATLAPQRGPSACAAARRANPTLPRLNPFPFRRPVIR